MIEMIELVIITNLVQWFFYVQIYNAPKSFVVLSDITKNLFSNLLVPILYCFL